MSQLTDEELMWNVAQGQLDDMSILFERYHLRIYNFLYQMVRDQAICEDITQNVFYKAIRYKHSYNKGNFASWIFKIARNNLSDYWVQQKKNNNNIAIDNISETIETDTNTNKEEITHLYSILDKLSNEDKELVVMNKLQGIKYEDIATQINSSPGAVKVKVHRILKKLRTHYFETA